jgi:hypothetical protein
MGQEGGLSHRPGDDCAEQHLLSVFVMNVHYLWIPIDSPLIPIPSRPEFRDNFAYRSDLNRLGRGWPLVVWPYDRIGAVLCLLPWVMLLLGARLGLRSLVAAGLRRLERGAVSQHGEHYDGESARERNPRLVHS